MFLTICYLPWWQKSWISRFHASLLSTRERGLFISLILPAGIPAPVYMTYTWKPIVCRISRRSRDKLLTKLQASLPRYFTAWLAFGLDSSLGYLVYCFPFLEYSYTNSVIASVFLSQSRKKRLIWNSTFQFFQR